MCSRGCCTLPTGRRNGEDPCAAHQGLSDQHERLARPLIELSESLKDGGNLGAHFDDETDASIEDAEAMLDLLDYLLIYLYVVPRADPPVQGRSTRAGRHGLIWPARVRNPGGTALVEKVPAIAAETVAKAAVAVFVPFGGVANLAWDGIRKGIASRTEKTINEILDGVPADHFAARCAESAEFEAVVVNALDAAARTGYEAKRRLLARVVINAAQDESRVDETALVVQTLRELDAPHIRALERIRAAYDHATLPEDDRRAIEQSVGPGPDRERELRARTLDARQRASTAASTQEPTPVAIALSRVGAIASIGMSFGNGLASGSITEFGRALLDELRPFADDEISGIRDPSR